MADILEVLQNAQVNLVNNRRSDMALMIGAEQLSNAITLIELGYPCSADVDELIQMHKGIDLVPEYKG